jgi:hypothetical protein
MELVVYFELKNKLLSLKAVLKTDPIGPIYVSDSEE